ncbi:MAG: hypothetical protein K6A90_06860 [Lachnospiraceae bacterium]|nr:hypothetical protein [Lachnospiraceae bacterium]
MFIIISDQKRKQMRWLLLFLIVSLMGALGVISFVAYIDPYFHYHAPNTDYYYTLDNERYQNDGITKHFDYNAILTGSSLIENFKTSEIDALFGLKTVKIPYSGATYKEINDNLKVAFETHENIRYVFRCLDMTQFFNSADSMRTDLGIYPTYLYDRNPFNDVNYLLNRDLIFERVFPIYSKKKNGEAGGITGFDQYANWMAGAEFGAKSVLEGRTSFRIPEEERHLNDQEKAVIEENIRKNVIEIATENPNTLFYIFIGPYSAAWWGEQYEQGMLYRQIEAEQVILELMLEVDNIRIFSFNNEQDITCNLDNYKDPGHYGEWINSLMLKYMSENHGLLTKTTYTQYLQEEKELYEKMDYDTLFDQIR